MASHSRVPGSFRDPSGFLFSNAGTLYRQVNERYASNFDALMGSGLYQDLIDRKLLIEHQEADLDLAASDKAYKIIRPTLVTYISYPYEWCFSQLKDAALLTLEVQKTALTHGMTLKDASAYNVQFLNGRPVFIDTLSFERYETGPWVAYRQFCQHFLAPLALKSYTDFRLGKLLRTNIDGIPLDLASRLLPRRTWLSYSVAVHLHLHARAQSRYADAGRAGSASQQTKVQVSKEQLQAIVDQLIRFVSKLQLKKAITEWGDYYEDTNYNDESNRRKRQLVADFLRKAPASSTVLDLGANNGEFSRVAVEHGAFVISQDIDEIAVEKNYAKAKKDSENILPLVQDLTNPSPAIGWANEERMALNERGSADVAMALALIHHIAISNNVPLGDCAKFFAQLARHLIIEFVPKSDSQVKRLLATREDIFDRYNHADFEADFSQYFDITAKVDIEHSERTLYLMSAKVA